MAVSRHSMPAVGQYRRNVSLLPPPKPPRASLYTSKASMTSAEVSRGSEVTTSPLASVSQGRALAAPHDDDGYTKPTPSPGYANEPSVPTDVPTNVPTDVPDKGQTTYISMAGNKRKPTQGGRNRDTKRPDERYVATSPKMASYVTCEQRTNQERESDYVPVKKLVEMYSAMSSQTQRPLSEMPSSRSFHGARRPAPRFSLQTQTQVPECDYDVVQFVDEEPNYADIDDEGKVCASSEAQRRSVAKARLPRSSGVARSLRERLASWKARWPPARPYLAVVVLLFVLLVGSAIWLHREFGQGRKGQAGTENAETAAEIVTAKVYVGENATFTWDVQNFEHDLYCEDNQGTFLFSLDVNQGRGKVKLATDKHSDTHDTVGFAEQGTFGVAIVNVSAQDAGNYTCREEGKVVKLGTLFVWGKPGKATIHEAGSEIKCDVVSTSRPKQSCPRMTYRWYENGSMILNHSVQYLRPTAETNISCQGQEEGSKYISDESDSYFYSG